MAYEPEPWENNPLDVHVTPGGCVCGFFEFHMPALWRGPQRKASSVYKTQPRAGKPNTRMPNSSSFSAPQQPLTVIWRRHTLDRVPEAQFIHTELLGRLGRPIRVLTVEHMQDMPFMNSVLIVSLTTESWPYLAEARRRGHKALALFHLGDEQGTDDLSAYGSADQVLRNYWFDAIQTRPNVTWVPNGY